MQFEWLLINVTTGREIQIYPWEKRQTALVRARILSWQSKQKTYQAGLKGIKLTPCFYDVKMVYIPGVLVSPDDPSNTLLRRCVKEIRPMKARTIKIGNKFVFMPPVEKRIVFCTGEDLLNQSVC